jgi:hypothetical protein
MICLYGSCGKQATAKKRPLCKEHYSDERKSGRLVLYGMVSTIPNSGEERLIRRKKRKSSKITVACANPGCGGTKELFPSVAIKSRFHYCDWDCRMLFQKALNDPEFYKKVYG